MTLTPPDGFTVLVDMGQYGQSDLSAATQPFTQQAVMHDQHFNFFPCTPQPPQLKPLDGFNVEGGVTLMLRPIVVFFAVS